MKRLLSAFFWRDDRGQDMVEYTLLIAFIISLGAAYLLSFAPNIAAVWNKIINDLNSAPRA